MTAIVFSSLVLTVSQPIFDSRLFYLSQRRPVQYAAQGYDAAPPGATVLGDRHTILERAQIVRQGNSPELAADHGGWRRYLAI